MTTKKKTFDCVEMKRRGAERIHEATKGLTLEQKIDYWRRRSEAFRQEAEKGAASDSKVRKDERKTSRS